MDSSLHSSYSYIYSSSCIVMSRTYEVTAKQSVPRIVERSTYALPAPDLEYLFKVTGKILVTDIVGEITEIPYVTRVDTMTIAGTGGTATILCDGVSRVLTFVAAISSSIDTFILDNAAAYLAGGVILTKSGTDAMVFTSNSPSLNFTGNTTGLNASGDLAGTVVATVPWTINVKLIANPTVGADVDMCADLNIVGAAVGATLNITGTLANAMVYTAGGAGVAQATDLVVHEGTIDLNTVVTPATGKIKWTIHYIPLERNSVVTAIKKAWFETL